MKKLACFLPKIKKIILILALIIAFFPIRVFGASTDQVDDRAGLLNEDEVYSLQTEAEEAAEATGWNIVLATTDETNGRSTEEYADDLYDEKFGINTDGIAIVIDMQNRRVHISTSGDAIKVISDRDVEDVIDAGYDALKSGEYKKCFHGMLREAVELKKDSIPHVSAGELAFAIAAGGLGFLITVLAVRGKYKATGQAFHYNYHQNGIVKVRRKEDEFLHESVHRARIRKENSGGSSTHISSSGGTHGGGGRSF